MLIGLGGGAASSMASGASTEDLDFASVQRGNPEMQRRAQQVIEACWAAGAAPSGRNPILIVHDVGAGGLSNAVPEARRSQRTAAGASSCATSPTPSPACRRWRSGATRRRSATCSPSSRARPRLVPRGVRARALPVRGARRADDSRRLVVSDRLLGESPVDMPLEMLLGKPPRTVMKVDATRATTASPQTSPASTWSRPAMRVLRYPAVADKSFLIHIGDRTVGGLVCRDQLVGPWQVPVSDVAVTALGFDGVAGEAMAMGERTPLAVLDPAGVRAHRRRRGADQRAAGGRRLRSSSAALGQLDGGERRATGEDEALYDTVARRDRPVPGAAHRDSGRQGLAVDAHRLAGARGAEVGRGAGIARSSRRLPRWPTSRRALTPQLRRDAGLAALPARSRRGPQPPRRLLPGAGLRHHRRRRSRTSTTPQRLRQLFRCHRGTAPARRCCLPTTTAPMAACS